MAHQIGALASHDADVIRSSSLLQSVAQCVSEIVENAIDACATTINIKLDLVALQFTVADDGIGINQQTLSLIGKRFHSSKNINRSINQSHDLIQHDHAEETFGCRGEALASLASIACVDIHTTPAVARSRSHASTYWEDQQADCTYSIRLSNHQRVDRSVGRSHQPSSSLSGATCSASRNAHSGTTVSVTRLFHCLPVRRAQLLQRRAYELVKIKTRIERLALIHPTVNFTLIDGDTNDRVLVSKAASLTILDSFTALFQSDAKSRLITLMESERSQSSYFKRRKHKSSVTKFFISSLFHVSHSKQQQFLFINRRPVKHPPLIKLIERLWLRCHRFILGQTINDAEESTKVRSSTRSPTGQRIQFASHPVIILQLHLPLDSFDCLADPDKQTCMFRDERAVTDMVRDALVAGLLNAYPVLSSKSDELFCDGPVDARFGSPSANIAPPGRSESRFAGYVAQFAISDSCSSPDADRRGDAPDRIDTTSNRLLARDCRQSSILSVSRPMNQSTQRAHSPQYIDAHDHSLVGFADHCQSNRYIPAFDRSESICDQSENPAWHPVDCLPDVPFERTPQVSRYSIEVISDSDEESVQPARQAEPAPPSAVIDVMDGALPNPLRFLPAAFHAGEADEDVGTLRFLKSTNKRKLNDVDADAKCSSPVPFSVLPLYQDDEHDLHVLPSDDWSLIPAGEIVSVDSSDVNIAQTTDVVVYDDANKRSKPASVDDQCVLSSRNSLPLISYRYEQPSRSNPNPLNTTVQSIFQRWRVQQPNDRTLGAIARDATDDGAQALETIDAQQTQVCIARSQLARMQVIGQCDKKFILVHVDDLIIALDQHAADERVRLESLQRQLPTLVHSHPINPPWVLSITSSELAVLRAYPDELRRWGWQVVVYPHDTITSDDMSNQINTSTHLNLIVHVLAVPKMGHSTLNENDLREFLFQLADRAPVTESVTVSEPVDWSIAVRPRAIDRLLASRSCRYAIMFNDSLTHDTMCDVVNGVSMCALPFQCAHGRPTVSVLAQLKRSSTSTTTPWENELAYEMENITMGQIIDE